MFDTHERRDGKLEAFKIDLSSLSKKQFNEAHDLIDRYSFICSIVPGKQVLRVFWNLEEAPESLIKLPPGSVSPWVDR